MYNNSFLATYPDLANLVDFLNYRAIYQPNQLAFSFLLDGDADEISLTYQELDQKAKAIAALLQSLKAGGERALLLYQPGLEFITAFFGCLYAGVIAVPVYPPRRNQHITRLQAIVADAQAKFALTTTSILTNLERSLEAEPGLAALHYVNTDKINSELAQTWFYSKVNSDTVAFLQYTSGSTGTPKGVIVTHENLLYNEKMIKSAFQHTEETIVVGWLPLHHDMGLIGNVLQPVYLGITSYLLSPMAFLQKPFRWLSAISRYKATTSGGPNFAYDLCVRKITPSQRASLGLSSWEIAFNAAEPIRGETLERFASTFADCGFRREAFYSCYGMAETTLLVSGGLKTSPPVLQTVQTSALEENQVIVAAHQNQETRTLVGCGRTWLDQKIIIANPKDSTLCLDGQVGEIWVSGKNVAKGYWNRSEETNQTFHAYVKDLKEGPFLRTGDLGFLQNGELFVTGRLKDLIIIRGHNYYPQDIEITVEQSHPGLQANCGAAFTVEINGQERLVIVQEVERHYRKLNLNEVIDAIRKNVVHEHELQVYAVLLLQTGTIPKTSSGKIQRYACRTGFLTGSLKVVERWQQSSIDSEPPVYIQTGNSHTDKFLSSPSKNKTTESIQNWLVSQIAQRLKSTPHDINIYQSFSDYGLDSLEIAELSGELSNWLGFQLPPALMYDHPNIKVLTDYLTVELSSEKSQTPSLKHPKSLEHRIQELNLAVKNLQDKDQYFYHKQISVFPKSIQVVVDDIEMKMFSSVSHLGLIGHPRIDSAACEAILRHGTGTHSARLFGELSLQKELEQTIAEFVDAEAAIVYSSGYVTNLTVIQALVQEHEYIIIDELSHASIYDGCKLTGAKLLRFRHNDLASLEELLQQLPLEITKLVVTEGVFSMDGDICDLPHIFDLSQKYKAWLMIDEGHSLGTLGKTGRGIEEHFGLKNAVNIKMGTLKKAIPSIGGYVAGKKELIDYLRHVSRAYIFSTPLPPAQLAAAIESFRVIQDETWRIDKLHRNVEYTIRGLQQRGFDTAQTQTGIIPILCGSNELAYSMAREAHKHKVYVLPVVAPAVPQGKARVRLLVTAAHELEDIEYTMDVLAEAGKKVGISVLSHC